jgi:hypothetical protein
MKQLSKALLTILMLPVIALALLLALAGVALSVLKHGLLLGYNSGNNTLAAIYPSDRQHKANQCVEGEKVKDEVK